MMTNTITNGVKQHQDMYTDVHRLDNLKNENNQAGLEKVAKEFEAIFLQMTLKSMRDASKSMKSELFSSHATETYEEMYDKQLSLNLSKGDSIGLAKMIVKQMGGNLPTSKAEAHLKVPEVSASQKSISSNTLSSITEIGNLNPNQQKFINELWPYAVPAAKEMGLDPKILIAQAALETGWGKTLNQEGTPIVNHNLFGIKAGKNWQGEKLSATTTEYYNNKPQKETANFRAYKNSEESFKDYVSFVKDNPRYKETLTHASSPKDYIQSLSKSGYATDPSYANKTIQIYQKVAKYTGE